MGGKPCNFFDRNGLFTRFNKRRKLIIIGLLLTSCYCILPLFFKTPNTYNGWNDPDFKLMHHTPKMEIIILMWTKYFREYGESPQILHSEKCSYAHTSPQLPFARKFTPCRVTHDRRYLDSSDALVFHSFDLMKEEVPSKRSKEKIWVYLQQESPIYTKLNLQAYDNVFNWTMTYRRDSDIYHPYGHFLLKSESSFEHTDLKNGSDILSNKQKLAAWIVSSCDSYSQREFLVHELQKYIQVDVYGWCGMDCPPKKDCYDHVSEIYKFYLSFENSLCTDYITEKFFNPMKRNVVPVVYGGTTAEDYSAIAPKDSYIDARNFKSMQDLAKYLLYLDKNDEEYLKYFAWKSKFQVVSTMGWCNICHKINEHLNGKEAHKWYKGLWKWWNYMGYDLSVEVDEFMPTRVSQSYYYKLGTRACRPPINFTDRFSSPDFEPGILNGKIFYKAGSWAQNIITGAD